LLLRDQSLNDPALDLAFDEALLESAEMSGDRRGILRLWEPDRPMVVVGRGSKVQDEVDLPRCRQEGVPVLRRCSGGAAVVGAPGCLMYAVVLSYDEFPELRRLDVAHRFVMERLAAAVNSLGIDARLQGTCDLTVGDLKVSGNALRCRRTHLLYHGTLLYDMNLELLDTLLRMPGRQPEYRRARTHRDFVACLPTDRRSLSEALIRSWKATAGTTEKPTYKVGDSSVADIEAIASDERRTEASLSAEHELLRITQQFADERYRSDSWNLRH